MAKLSARGRSEVLRYFDLRTGTLYALMSDGRTLSRTVFHGWREARRFKGTERAGCTLTEYLDRKVRSIRAQTVSRPATQCQCDPPHDVRTWGKGGKVGYCPCPNPQTVTLEPYYSLEITSLPSRESLERWTIDSVCESLDGCDVEPNGICPHGTPSWLRALRMI